MRAQAKISMELAYTCNNINYMVFWLVIAVLLNNFFGGELSIVELLSRTWISYSQTEHEGVKLLAVNKLSQLENLEPMKICI